MAVPPPSRPNPRDVIVAVADGTDPPPYHVRQQEHLIDALPRCALVAADRGPLSAVAIEAFGVTVWLPPHVAAGLETQDWGERIAWRVTLCWEGANGASLDLTLEREPGLPRLHAITKGPAGAESVRIAGRPMLLERDHPAAPGVPCAANIRGFPRDDLTFFAPSREERDELLRCVMTLSADGEAA